MQIKISSFGLLALLWCYANAVPATEGAFSFGIAPQQAVTELAKRWTPVLEYISEKSGVKLNFITAKDIATYQVNMQNGQYDFSFINPYHYTQYQKKAGYRAFAREKEGLLVGILVARTDGAVKSVFDLQHQTLAFPSANAMAATWLQLQYLKSEKIDVTPQFVNSMDSVYRAVAKGLFPAGGGELRTFGAVDGDIKAQLKILWRADPMPSHPFSYHPRVPKNVVEKVKAAMLKMADDPRGLELLHAINFKGIEATRDSDYDVVRIMKLQPLK